MRLGCAQYGGVVSMYDGAVTFKGGTITNTKATVRTGHDARSHAGTGCRMLRGLRRAVCGARCMGMRDSMARSRCAVSAAGRGPPLGQRPALWRHVAGRCTLCCMTRACCVHACYALHVLATLQARCRANRRLGGMEHTIIARTCAHTQSTFAIPRVHFLQLRGAVALIGAGTLLLDDITISSTDNTTVSTFGSF